MDLELPSQILRWARLAVVDIRSRYRQTVIGPLWIVVSTAITTVVLGVVYGSMFRLPLEGYLPFVAAGLVIFGLFSGSISESCIGLISYKALLQSLPIAPELIIVRIMVRNVIVFLHNLLVFAVTLFIFGQMPTAVSLLAIPGFILFCCICYAAGLLLSFLAARFRDVYQIVVALMSMAFLATPILWSSSMLGDRQYLAEWNPLTHFIAVVRDPLLGRSPPAESWAVTCMGALCLGLAAFCFVRRLRHRLRYWL